MRPWVTLDPSLFPSNGSVDEHHEELTNLLNRIDHPALQAFVALFWKDTALVNGFLVLPASQNNHHAFEHGLLIHSLEVVHSALGALSPLSISENAKQLALIGAVFHDLGKAAYCADTGKMIYQGHHHEQCTIGILYPALQKLRIAQPLWYETLMAAWTKETYPRQESTIVKAIKLADQLSASQQLTHQRFITQPAHYYFLNENHVRRLRTPK